MSTETNQPWSYQRLRRRIDSLIEIVPLANVGDSEMRADMIHKLKEDLAELRDGLDQWYGEGIFTEKKGGN